MSLTLALCQYSIAPKIGENVSFLLQRIQDEGHKGTHLILVPEMCLTGFASGAKETALTMENEVLLTLDAACRAANLLLVGTFCIRHKGAFFNRALCLGGVQKSASYDKQRPFILWREKEEFTAGQKPVLWRVGDWTLAPLICFDLRFPELFRESLDADLFIVPANWPASRRDHWLTLLKARAIENQAYVAGVNRIGIEDGVSFTGDSVLYDYRGRELLNLQDTSCCERAQLSLSSMHQYRKRFPVLKECRLKPPAAHP